MKLSSITIMNQQKCSHGSQKQKWFLLSQAAQSLKSFLARVNPTVNIILKCGASPSVVGLVQCYRLPLPLFQQNQTLLMLGIAAKKKSVGTLDGADNHRWKE